MHLKILTPKQSLNKAFRKVNIYREEFDIFRNNLSILLANIDKEESEENVKNHLKDFLNETYYKNKHLLNTKNRTDLVIYLENKQDSNAGVLLEVKRPANKPEMITPTDLNRKAFHELILYYLQERIEHKNDELKYLIATNIYEWFIFDAVLFENLFYKNSQLIKNYNSWKNDQKVSGRTDHFYDEILNPFLENLTSEISFSYFNFSDYVKLINVTDKEIEKKLIPLFKILSPSHLLKQPFVNDSNSLDRNFYNELLHIIGLEEVKEKNKKVINRKKPGEREYGSFIENTIQILKTDGALDRITGPKKFGDDEKEQLYHIALELSLTWINRILFLKLLESQLYNYHLNEDFKFLNSKTISDFDELYKLFHSVLAVKVKDRTKNVNEKYARIPYLNSSLFEKTGLEDQAIRINMLDNSAELQIYKATVLKDNKGKKKNGKLPALQYLFEFLDAYNFTSDGKEDIEEERKTLINASVLGLIFEKINGYKDGSYFTPGFITMYMSRETIRRSIVQKFNDKYEWGCEKFDDLKNHLAVKRNTKDILEANEVINSLKICDPAVGSGHFLVSALNEIITIKSELGILADENGVVLNGYEVKIENDELITTYNFGEEIFEYHPLQRKSLYGGQSQSQIVQQTLFKEKQTIIENCLFGVDINPNSVKIAQLRLWIELLKNAFYTKESGYAELETLPNIDINIKEGNSLVSKFDVKQDIFSHSDKQILDVYRLNVGLYKNESDHEKRKSLKKSIESTKKRIRGFAVDPLKKERDQIQKLTEQLEKLTTGDFFDKERSAHEQKKVEQKIDEVSAKINKLMELKDKKAEEYRTLYSNAFEWRFEFPEVLDEEGNFVGFDIVIGNPPYYSLSKAQEFSKYFEEAGYKTYTKGADIYCLFYEKGNQILKQERYLTYITSNSWLRSIYGIQLKKYFNEHMHPINLLNIEDIQIFEEATVESNIIMLQKDNKSSFFLVANLAANYDFGSSLSDYFNENCFEFNIPDNPEWVIGDESFVKLKIKVEKGSKLLKQFDIGINFGIKSGFNSAFIIDTETKNVLIKQDPKATKIIKPILRGRDLKKYSCNYANYWAICTFPSIKLNIENYPSILNYLLKFGKGRLEQSGKKGSRKKTSHKWFETQDSIVYWEDFEKPKIIWGEISDEPKFAFDNDHFYAEATTFIMTGEKLKYLLAILNSKVAEWYFKQIGTTTGMGTNRWKKYKIELLPIKIPSEEMENKIEDLVNKIIDTKKLTPNADTTKLETEIDQIVYKLYGLTEDEIKIVEGE